MLGQKFLLVKMEEEVRCDDQDNYSLSQWLNFKLFGITYLVGKIKFKLFFPGSIGWVRLRGWRWRCTWWRWRWSWRNDWQMVGTWLLTIWIVENGLHMVKPWNICDRAFMAWMFWMSICKRSVLMSVCFFFLFAIWIFQFLVRPP